jgi:hypothetical protein
MWTIFSPFHTYSYVEASIKYVNHSCHDKSFPAIPNMPRFHWTKVVRAPALLHLVLRELQYVLQYTGINTNFAYKQLILVFLLNFSVVLAQTHLASQPPQPWPPPTERCPSAPHEALRSTPMHQINGS